MPRIKVNRWELLSSLVHFYLLFMGAVVAVMAMVTASAHSWFWGVSTIVVMLGACVVAREAGKRLSTSSD